MCGSNCEEQLIVVATSGRSHCGVMASLLVPPPYSGIDRKRVGVDRDAGVRRLRDGTHAVGEAVAQVDARRRRAIAAEQEARTHARLRPQVPFRQFTYVPAGGHFRCVPAGGHRLLQRPQTHRGSADRSGHVDRITGTGTGTREGASRADGANRGDIDNERTGRVLHAQPGGSCDVASNESNSVPGRKREQPVEHRVEEPRGQIVRQHERQQRSAGRCAHGCEIAQIDGQRAMPDRVGRYEPPIEMDALDLRVGGEDVKCATLRLDNRRIVAGTHDDPGRLREAGGDALDEGPLSDLADGTVIDCRQKSFRVLDRTRLPDDRHLDLAGILQFALDAARDVLREPDRLLVGDLLALDHDAHLAARLQRERL
jgi:hypothetical protein